MNHTGFLVYVFCENSTASIGTVATEGLWVLFLWKILDPKLRLVFYNLDFSITFMVVMWSSPSTQP